MKKKFDAVNFQREVREELSKEYNVDRERFICGLKEKYGYLQKIEHKNALQITQSYSEGVENL